MSSADSASGSSYVLALLKNVFSRTIKSSHNVPAHVGFIMDGNRRYARRKGIDIKEGHDAGFTSMSRVLELCYEAGVHTATVFAFSIENFKRTPYEVESLMQLARRRIKQLMDNGELADKYGIRIRVIGDLSLLDMDVLEDIRAVTERTQNNSRAVLNICFPYTGRDEIVHSIRSIAEAGIPGAQISEQTIEDNLYTGGVPPLDLLVRTSGVSRLSDFMLWQVSQRGVVIELLDCLWPEFTPLRMAWILIKFAFRNSNRP